MQDFQSKVDASIQNYSAEKFENWLITGFKALRKNDPEAFKPLQYIIHGKGPDSNPIVMLSIIYEMCLNERTQKHFCQAITTALSTISPLNKPLLTDFLQLATKIKMVEICFVIDEWILIHQLEVTDFPNKNTAKAIKERDEFFAFVTGRVAELSVYAEEKKFGYHIARTLRKLINHKLFKNKYTPKVFIALCQAEPKSFMLHINFTCKIFDAMHREEENLGDSWMTARRVVQCIPLKIIQVNLAQLPDWLIWGFFQHAKAPLKIELVKSDVC